MDRTSMAVLMALAASACESAEAQNQSSGVVISPVRSSALERLTSQIRLVDPALFVARPLQVEVETMMPAVVDGQIRYYGGPLQTYLNLAGADVTHATHLPFGATAILPMNRWHLEVFGGMGGAWAPFHTSYAMTNSWMVQTSMVARVALVL
ncbi:MAG: hypothetical protein ABUS51_07005 [Acidobacteriota bacterium]